MRKPSIHLNGTSRGELVGNYRAAHEALQAAIEALQKTAPHGRDYYIQDGDAIQEAMREYRERFVMLDKVLQELEEICIGIMD